MDWQRPANLLLYQEAPELIGFRDLIYEQPQKINNKLEKLDDIGKLL